MNYRPKSTGYTYRRKSYSSLRSSRRKSSKGGQRNTIQMVFFAFVVLLIGFVIFKLIGVLFDTVRAEEAKAELQVQKGKVEYYFAQQEQWQSASSGLQFISGERIRTTGNSKASLNLFTGNTIFLNENTTVKLEKMEERSSGRKDVFITLEQGQLWIRTATEDFSATSESSFVVQTPRSRTNVYGAIFDIESTLDQDVIRLIRGNVDVDIFQDDPEDIPWNILVEVGQKLVISNEIKEKLKNENQDIKEIVDNDFLESEWHIQNIEPFFPQDAAEIKRRIELKTPTQPQAILPVSTEEPLPDNLPVVVDRGTPEFLSPAQGALIAASSDSLEIEGTAPENTMQIVVNGYTLSKFSAGDRKWRYFASKSLGTMVPGENTYEVVAVFKDGQKSPPVSLTVMYEAPVFTEMTQTDEPLMAVDVGTSMDPSVPVTQSDFKAPVIMKPAAILPGEQYQTSAESFTIVGLVDPKTERVVINGYTLQKFKTGDTEFRYTVNAAVQNPNLVVGENNYIITAYGPEGRQATTTITIVYTPITQ